MLKKAKMPPSWRGFVTCVLLATVRVAMSGRTCPFIKAEQLLFDIVYIVGFCGCLFSIKDIYIYIVYIWYICIIQHDHENISNTGQPRKIGERLISQSYEEVLPEPWDEESPWTQNLMTETGLQGKARFFKVDIWHVVHMGVAKDFISSALCLVQVLLDGSNVDCRFQHMTTLYKDWCKKNKKTKYLTKLTKDTVGGCGKRDEPAAGWNKAAVSTTLMEFTDYLCDLYREQCEQDERLRMVVS